MSRPDKPRIQIELENDLRTLVDANGPTPCGPIMVRLSWHDAGVYSNNKSKGLTGGCPNAAMRHAGGGESQFDANKGLPDVALKLIAPITEKYSPHHIGHADLWALAANIAIEAYGGPKIETLFGRKDAVSHAESVSSAEGRLPDGAQGSDHLRDIFWPKGFSDRDIVALSGAHTLGRCHGNRSGFEGPWTDNPLEFDNSYFVDLVNRDWVEETNAAGKIQFNDKKSGNMMLVSDMALVTDPAFYTWVDRYAKDEAAFFEDFADAWSRLQILGYDKARMTNVMTVAKL